MLSMGLIWMGKRRFSRCWVLFFESCGCVNCFLFSLVVEEIVGGVYVDCWLMVEFVFCFCW